MSEQRSVLSYLKYGFYGIVACVFLYKVFGPSSGGDYIEETLEDPTQGIIAHIQEVDENLFKITDEQLIDQRIDSRIIATYQNNSIDTFTLEQISLTEANDPRRSILRSVAMAGMFGYMMGRPMSSGITRSAYANDNSFNKSNTSGRNQLSSTSKRSVVRKPVNKGFGSGKSTKSYGG